MLLKRAESTLGALVVLGAVLAGPAGVALGAESTGGETPVMPAPGPLEATELSPLGGVLPGALDALWVVLEGDEPVPFAVLVKRIGEAGGVAVAIEERPARIKGGEAVLPDPPAVRPGYEGPLGRLLDRVAAECGYRWGYEADTVVFFRYWDTAEQRRLDASVALAGPTRWAVNAAWHGTLREVLEAWTARGGWTLVWKAADEYALSADAQFEGDLLEAVDQLFSSPAVRRLLVASAYTANRYLVIEDAGTAR